MKHKIFVLLVIGTIICSLSIASLYPLMYKDLINKYSQEYELDPFLVLSVIKRESSFDENAISKKHAKGLMQISDSTGQWAAESLNIEKYNMDLLYDPETNIRIGTWYLSKLIKQFGSIDLALAAYNAGSGNVQAWLKDNNYSEDGKSLSYIPFIETREYISKVEKSYNAYKIIYWHPYFLENENIFDNVCLKSRELIIKIVRKLR
ncbi:MAG: lytic transglycosylase domain-containing protein [Gudongella sp.]|nr:lytic transglycosylase domain-containing protein [Gudongella sp.]